MKLKAALFITNPFVNDSRVKKEAKSLAKSDFDVIVVALHEGDLPVEERMDGFRVNRIRLITKRLPRIPFIQMLKYLEFFFKAVFRYRHIDICHCNDLDTLPIGWMIKILSYGHARVMYDAHEWESNDQPNQSRNSIFIRGLLERILIGSSDTMLTVSESIADEYVKRYRIARPAVVLNCPERIEVSHQDLFRREFNVRPDQLIFLYQGGIGEGRGIEIILEAFAGMTDDRCAIVFMGNGSLEGHVKEYAEKISWIYHKDAVPNSVLLNWSASADFGILFYENVCLNNYLCSPNKMFEYLMADRKSVV